MGHENAQRVYEIYAKRIEKQNSEQVAMLNPKLALKMDLSHWCPI
jgi:integrase